MHALAAGMGISRYDAMGLIEECDSRGRWFMASALRGHIVRGRDERYTTKFGTEGYVYRGPL